MRRRRSLFAIGRTVEGLAITENIAELDRPCSLRRQYLRSDRSKQTMGPERALVDVSNCRRLEVGVKLSVPMLAGGYALC